MDVLRKELKYILHKGTDQKIIQRVSVLMASDSNNGIKGYKVRSLYFDTIYDKDYHEKIEGNDNRCKIRLRIYNSSDSAINLELKEKLGSLQRKRSIRVTRQEAEKLIGGDYSCLAIRNEELAQILYHKLTQQLYMPKTIVEYNRKAYTLAVGDLRVTFDSKLTTSQRFLEFFNENLTLYPVTQPQITIMEVKYSTILPSYIIKALSISDTLQTSASKYCAARSILLSGESISS